MFLASLDDGGVTNCDFGCSEASLVTGSGSLTARGSKVPFSCVVVEREPSSIFVSSRWGVLVGREGADKEEVGIEGGLSGDGALSVAETASLESFVSGRGFCALRRLRKRRERGGDFAESLVEEVLAWRLCLGRRMASELVVDLAREFMAVFGSSGAWRLSEVSDGSFFSARSFSLQLEARLRGRGASGRESSSTSDFLRSWRERVDRLCFFLLRRSSSVAWLEEASVESSLSSLSGLGASISPSLGSFDIIGASVDSEGSGEGKTRSSTSNLTPKSFSFSKPSNFLRFSCWQGSLC